MKIKIQNCSFITSSAQKGEIAIARGIIQQVGKVKDFTADKIIDGSGKLAIPGLVDLSAKLYNYGNINSILTESKAAVAGGITTICLAPDTNPIINNPAVVELIEQRQLQADFARIIPLGAISKSSSALTDMGALREEGCVGFSNIGEPIKSLNVLWRAMQYASTLGFTLHLLAMRHDLAQDGTVHTGAMGSILGLPGIPYIAETIALSEIIILAKATDAKVHICRVSSKDAVAMIRLAKQEGVNITADVGINYLFYTDENVANYDYNFHVLPPFRESLDRQALRQAVLDGTIDAICSDHQPHSQDSKLKPFSQSAFGISNLETFLAQVLQFCRQSNIEFQDILPLITSKPAEIAKVGGAKIAVGATSDIVLFDPDKSWRLTADEMFSQGKNTPLLNQELIGQNQISIVDGKVVFERK